MNSQAGSSTNSVLKKKSPMKMTEGMTTNKKKILIKKISTEIMKLNHNSMMIPMRGFHNNNIITNSNNRDSSVSHL
jgi:hypothetical protein